MATQRPWLKYLGFGCGGLLLVVAAFVAVTYFVVTRMTAEPERVVREFLDAAAAGDFATAHGHFSAPLKEAQTLEAFTAAARARPSLFAVASTSFSSRSIEGGVTKLEGTATLVAGTTVPVSFSLVEENGRWVLLAYNLGAP